MRILLAMSISVAVAGASGYAGGELLRLILGHPEFELAVAAAGGNAGQPITSVHPGLAPLADRTFTDTDAATLAAADLVFLALPHGQSAAIAAQLPAGTPVVDLGADHRLVDPAAWTTYYGGSHAGSWLYALPELPGVRQALPGATRIAAPGCYATAIALSAAPLLAAGLIDPDLVVVAASGTSGAGRAPSAALLASEVMGSMKAYKAGGVHQHTPEIEQSLGAVAGTDVTLSFTPMLAPMSRGILAVTSAPLTGGHDTAALRAAVTAAYAGEPFVHLLPAGDWPVTAATYGANTALLQVAADGHAGRATVVTAIDNLVKGAAGQAIQCANLALGLPETAGLPMIGVAP